MTVRIHIEQLVVEGWTGAGSLGDAFVEELIAELRRLAASAAPPLRDPADELTADPYSDPWGAGRAVAAVVHTTFLLTGARNG